MNPIARFERSIQHVMFQLAWGIALAAFGVFGAREAASATPRTGTIDAFVGVNVVPMTSPEALLDQTVIVRDGRITQIGPRIDVAVPAGARVISPESAWLMPGLADMHVHLWESPQSLDLFLANGITTVRELDGTPQYLTWAREIADGRRVGPTLMTTGPIINSEVGSYPTHDVAVNTRAQARAEIERQWRAGYRMIKVYTGLPADAYDELVKQAKKRGMYVTGHIPDSVGLAGIIAAGQDEIAHTEELRSEFMVGYDPGKMFSRWPMDAARIKPVADRIAQAHVAVVTSLTTLHALYDQTADTKAVLARPEIAYQLPFATAEMRKEDYGFAHRLPADYLEDTLLPHFDKTIRGLEDAGVRLIAGTDSGLPGIVWGWGTHQELQFLVQAGLTPYEALRTATVTPAETVPGPKDWGVIRVGAQADLLLVAGNPLEDIKNTHRILGVMKAGHWIDQQERERLLACAKAAIGKAVIPGQSEAAK